MADGGVRRVGLRFSRHAPTDRDEQLIAAAERGRRDDRGDHPHGPGAADRRRKEKVLAAHRAGIGMVILPKLNEDGLAELPDKLRDGDADRARDRIEQVLDILEPMAQPV